MKRFIVLLTLISFAGCTTLRPITGPSNELQIRIGSGVLLEAGDRVSIVTADKKTHKFRVRRISAGMVIGRSDSVPIDQIVSLQTREFSRGKTWLLIGCGVLFTGLIIYALAQAAPAFALESAP